MIDLARKRAEFEKRSPFRAERSPKSHDLAQRQAEEPGGGAGPVLASGSSIPHREIRRRRARSTRDEAGADRRPAFARAHLRAFSSEARSLTLRPRLKCLRLVLYAHAGVCILRKPYCAHFERGAGVREYRSMLSMCPEWRRLERLRRLSLACRSNREPGLNPLPKSAAPLRDFARQSPRLSRSR